MLLVMAQIYSRSDYEGNVVGFNICKHVKGTLCSQMNPVHHFKGQLDWSIRIFQYSHQWHHQELKKGNAIIIMIMITILIISLKVIVILVSLLTFKYSCLVLVAFEATKLLHVVSFRQHRLNSSMIHEPMLPALWPHFE